MDLFKTLNTIEDGIRRTKIEKSGTEKMGSPHVMGGGERSEVLSDSAKEQECSETESDSEEKCEKSSELMGALKFFKTARESGSVQFQSVEKMDADQLARMKAEHSDMRGKKTPKEGKGAKWQAAAAEASKKDAPKEGSKKKTPSKKAAPKKSAKKPAAKKGESGAGKGKSTAGSGQSGRTGSRKRRSVGDFWWAKDGNKPGTTLWTKRGPGSIVRANAEEKKKYKAESKKRGLKDKQDIDLETPHKKRAAYVKKIKSTKNLTKYLTKEQDLALTEQIVAAGFATAKEKEKIKRIKETLCAYKLSLGKPSRWARTPEQVKRDYIDAVDVSSFESRREFNKYIERVERMSVKDFDVMMRSIEFDEDEDVLREMSGIQGTWKAQKSFDEALEDIVKSMM